MSTDVLGPWYSESTRVQLYNSTAVTDGGRVIEATHVIHRRQETPYAWRGVGPSRTMCKSETPSAAQMAETKLQKRLEQPKWTVYGQELDLESFARDHPGGELALRLGKWSTALHTTSLCMWRHVPRTEGRECRLWCHSRYHPTPDMRKFTFGQCALSRPRHRGLHPAV